MQAKYKIGEKVVYNRDSSAVSAGLSRTVEVFINKVSLDYNGIPFSQSLYTVSWPPTGCATIGESDLSPATTPASAAAPTGDDGTTEERSR